MKRWTFDEFEEALAQCDLPKRATPLSSPKGENVVPLPQRRMKAQDASSALAGGGPAPVLASIAGSTPDMNKAAQRSNGLLAGKTPEQQHDIIRAIVFSKWGLAIADQNRSDRKVVNDVEHPSWLDIIFALKHADSLDIPGMMELAQQWSQTAPTRYNEDDFERDWKSADPKRPGGITTGTLIDRFIKAGNAISSLPHMSPGIPSAGAGANFPTVGKPAPWHYVPHVMDEGNAVPILNQHFGFARKFGGGTSYFMLQHDGTVQPVNHADLRATLAPYRVRVRDGATTKLVPAAPYWINSPSRYTVDDVIYDPENKLTGQNILNTWHGLAVTPAKGRWRRIGWHLLHVICSGNKQYWKYLMRWLAHAVQFPGTSPEVMVVMRSDAEGTGKSTVGNIMVSIFGQHGHVANSLSEIFGEFNESIVNTSFLLLEENAFPGDHKQTNSIKAFITARRLSINPKGLRRFTIPNMLHLMMCTNDSWAIPAGADARRFLMLDVTEKKDQSYFDALCAERDGGGLAAFLDALLKIDLRGFQPRLVPRTKALVIQQRRSADSLTQWLTDAVATGVLMPGDPTPPGGGFGQRWTAAQLHATYRQWVRDQGAGRPMNAVEFGRQLGRLGFTKAKSNGLAAWDIPDRITVLNSVDRRAGIQAVTP